MSPEPHVFQQLRSERGSITVTVAILIPVFALFLALVVITGQWYGHRQHLQTQVDAAVLAAAQDLQPGACNSGGGPMDAAIGWQAGGGEAIAGSRVADYGETKNPQVQGTNPNVHLLVNSGHYFDRSANDDTDTRAPSCALAIDVKATETDLQGIMGLGLANVVPFAKYIDAHARVQLKQVDSLSGNIPIGIPEPAPKAGRVLVIDESNGNVLDSQPLAENGTNGAGDANWDNTGHSLNVTVGGRSKLGVRVVLSGRDPSDANATTCGQPLVTCYDADPANHGLSFIQGWTNDGNPAVQTAEPKVRSVNLLNDSCADGYFVTTPNCTFHVQATVDFGTGTNDPTRTDSQTPKGVGAALRAVVNGNNYDMTWSAANGWTSGAIPVGATSGPRSVDLEWAEQYGKVGNDNCSAPNNGNPFSGSNKCHKTVTDVQRIFLGDSTRSGPVSSVLVGCESGSLSCAGGALGGFNSLRQCDQSNTTCTYKLVVHVGVQGKLKIAQSANEPPITLRTSDQNQTQSLDCDPGVPNYRDELANGCQAEYGINHGTACPNKSTLWGSAQPWRCVVVGTGTTPNEIARGMNKRVFGSETATSCTNTAIPTDDQGRGPFGPNRYKVDFPNYSHSDPRVVQVVVTPFGAFAGSGTDTVPVTNLATFYVTGWKGQGSSVPNPCETNDQPSLQSNMRDDIPASAGDIVGHFIGYAQLDGSPGNGNCNDNGDVTTCVPVLTR